MDMRFTVFIMGVMLLRFERNQIQLAVPHTTFGNQGIRKLPNLGCRAFQNHRLKTVFVIEMGMHRSHSQIMVIMLQTGQPLSQLTLMVIKNVRQVSHAMATRFGALAITFNRTANQVTDSLRAVAITPVSDQLIKLTGQ
jgi:hypothetical protein